MDKKIAQKVPRRRFLAATGTAGVAGVAGCSLLTGDSQPEEPAEDTDEDTEGPAASTPEELVEQLYDAFNEQQRQIDALRHSAVTRGYRIRAVETTVVERALSTEEFASWVGLDGETAETVAADAETAIVEASYEVSPAGRTEEDTLALATDDGQWRLVKEGIGRRPSADSGDETDTPERDERIPESVHEYLVENDASGYDGTPADMTGRSSVTISVGAGDSGLTFDPAVVIVDAGTEITWEWTGRGGGHSVAISRGPAEFETEIVVEAGHTFSRTLTESGNYLYRCLPHQALGMHGAVVVE